eukprot:28234-Rhodomonas_salina.3
MGLVDDTKQILIVREQLKAANKALTEHLQHALCGYDLLKSMVALGAKIITRGTSEVIQPVGTNIELLVQQLPLELTPVNLYRAYSGQMAPGTNLQFLSGIMDMQLVRTKADGTQLTEGKYAVVHVQMTVELHEFLKTGHGWEMGIEALDGSDKMVPVMAVIRLDRELWVRIAKNDQTTLYFELCRIVLIPFRKAVWQYCKCLTACYAMSRLPQVRFTTVEFSPTGFKPKGQRSQGPAPGVDYYDDGVAIYVVCVDLRALGALQGATVQTFVWLEEPTAAALATTMISFTVQFDHQSIGVKQDMKAEDVAVQDARTVPSSLPLSSGKADARTGRLHPPVHCRQDG